ncbi:MAG: ABC transporter ATP-binding protein [Actinomycetota bacterium]
MLFTDLLSLLIPWIIKMAIDGIREEPQQTNLLVLAALLVAVASAQGVFRFYMRKLLVGISRKIEYSIRTDFFSHLQKIHSSFFTNTRTGSIMALATNDLEAVRNFLGPGILNLFNTIFVFVSTLTVMFLINARLSLYSLIAIPILPILVSKLSSMLHTRFRASQEQYATLSARTQESIAGIKVVKSFTQEDHEKNVFSGLNQEYIERNLSLAKIRAAFWPAMIFVGGVGTLVVLLVGGRQVIEGTLTLGQFVQFSAYIGSITWPLISLGWVINLVQRGSVSMKRINKVLDIKPEIKTPKKPVRLEEITGDMEFKDVFFRYENEKNYDDYIQKNIMDSKLLSTHSNGQWVLKDISFNIEGGMQAGIVGFTGSAKSTLLNLMVRLYDPQKGQVCLDGHNLKSIDLDILRSHIGYVSQEPFLFSKTIKENILFGCRDIHILSEGEIRQKIEHAARVSQLHEEIAQFPQGYDTVIGERGITLSGGQKQRLAIARAMAMKPSLLILDDSFSNIDTDTEEKILANLRNETGNITTVIVSHRISTIKDSDLILVVDEGEITESGSHSKLLKSCGIYRKLYYRQKLSEELEEEV